MLPSIVSFSSILIVKHIKLSNSKLISCKVERKRLTLTGSSARINFSASKYLTFKALRLIIDYELPFYDNYITNTITIQIIIQICDFN